MNKKIVFTVVFLAFLALASAQDTSWSLIRCVETGLQNTIEIKIRQLEIKKNRKITKFGFKSNVTYCRFLWTARL